MTYRSHYAALAASTCIVALATPAAAQTRSYNIPASDLATALDSFARQSGVQIVYKVDEVQGRRSKAVKGSLYADDALRRLLSGSGFEARRDGATVFAVVRVGNAQDATADGGDNQSAGIAEILVVGSRSQNVDIRRSEDDPQPYVVIDKKAIERSGASNVEDLLRNKLAMSYIDPGTNGAGTGAQTAGLGNGNQSLISLRGLGQGETLILVNGRRLGRRSGSANVELQGDLNGIPLSAIDRIEVLPATASGIYGGGATAGVINVILKRDFDGVTASATYGNSLRGDNSNLRLNLVGGTSFNGGRTSVLLSASYERAKPPRFGDLNYLARYRQKSYDVFYEGFPQLQNFAPLGSTTNVATQSQLVFVPAGTPGATCVGTFCFISAFPNLTLRPELGGTALGSPRTSVPSGYSGINSDNGVALVKNAGIFNFAPPISTQTTGTLSSLIADTKVVSGSLNVDHKFSSDVRAFLDLSLAENDSDFYRSSASGYVSLASGVPGNPFGQAITASFPLTGLIDRNSTRSFSFRGTGGVIFSLPHSWVGDLEHTYDRNRLRQSLTADTFSASLNDDVASGVIDIFNPTQMASVDWKKYLLPPTIVQPTISKLNSTSFRLAGPVGRLPGGGIPRVTALVERTQQDFGKFIYSGVNSGGPFVVNASPQKSLTYSAYLEARLPLVTEKMSLSWLRTVDAQISMRYDNYEMVGGEVVLNGPAAITDQRTRFTAFSPTLALSATPLKGIMLRGSYSAGFRPPPLGQLRELAPATPFVFGLTDPMRGGEPLGTIIQRVGGRPDLKPEDSKSWSAGFVFEPAFFRGFRLSADWVRIKKSNNITTLGLTQETVNREGDLPGFLTRAAPTPGDPYSVGPIVGVDGRAFNGTGALSEAIDFALDLPIFENRFGRLSFHGSGTRVIHSTLQLNPLVSSDEYVGTLQAPKWSAIGTLSWERGAFNAQWTTRYYDSVWVQQDHQISLIHGSARLPASLMHDLFSGYKFNNGLEIQFGVKNILNTRPEFFGLQANLYDPRFNPTLRSFYLTARKTF